MYSLQGAAGYSLYNNVHIKPGLSPAFILKKRHETEDVAETHHLEKSRDKKGVGGETSSHQRQFLCMRTYLLYVRVATADTILVGGVVGLCIKRRAFDPFEACFLSVVPRAKR